MSEYTSSGEKVVLAFIDALNQEDFELAKTLVADDLVFKGVMGERHGAHAYFDDMQKMKFKYQIQKSFVADSGNICLAYDIDMGEGKTTFSFGWYQLEEERIKNFRVVFDPRPLLSKS